MARITPGNRLYLYQLLSRELGVGRQTMLARVEEVLTDDDILPCDLECADVREVVEALDDFLRLTVFKKGRIYVTVIARAELDEQLARAAEPASGTADKGAGNKGGHRSWKRKKTARIPKPAKPRPHGRPTEEPEATEAEMPEVATEATVDVAGDLRAVETEGGSQAVDGATDAEGAVAEGSAPIEGGTPAEEGAPTEGAEVTGQVEDATELEAELDEAKGADDAQGGYESAAKSATEAGHEADATIESIAETGAEAAEAKAAAESQIEMAPKAEAAAGVDVETETEGEIGQATAASADSLATPSIKLRIVSEPEPELDLEIFEIPAPEPEMAPEPEDSPAKNDERGKVEDPWAGLPHHFAADVLCGDAELSELYQALPFDVDPMVILDEDWRVARSTGDFEQEMSQVSFALRCIRADGSGPVRVTMRHIPPTATGKRWRLDNIEGTDDLAMVGLGGLAEVDEGSWTALSTDVAGKWHPVSPLRELAQTVAVGPWETLLAELADIAEDEDWGDGRSYLRDYLAVEFNRILREEKFVFTDDGMRAAWDTGLLARDGKSVYCVLDACEGDIPWRLESFATKAPEGLAPEPTAYVSRLEDITLAAPYTVRVRKALLKSYGKELEEQIETAVLRARRNYRLATPAYDPQRGELRLFLPVCLGESVHAVVLRPTPGEAEAYEACATIPLDLARACARVVSAELPSWLG